MPFSTQDHLTTGGDDHFLHQLKAAINHADRIDLAVSFIKLSGLNFIHPALVDAIEAGVKVRILTGDYLQITDPQSLNKLMLLKEKGAELKVFESGQQSFHPKVYLFVSEHEGEVSDGRVFIGSSNISKSALFDGIEWNIRIEYDENPERFLEILDKYQTLFDHNKTTELTYEWIEKYREQFHPMVKLDPGDEVIVPTPNEVQIECLKALKEAREKGVKRGLVVMATGLGKTWLAAFDTEQVACRKILFVAHREEILDQAEATFLKIKPKAIVGRYTGREKNIDVDILFASVQTLGQLSHLRQFASNTFNYIIIDEFHHAAARTYQNLLKYFNPFFLLGLTATPDRTDRVDILELCDGNLIYSKDLIEGVRLFLLSPFAYYGIYDKHVNYEKIPWRSRKFDPKELEKELATQERAEHVLMEWKNRAQERTLGFCASIAHADFMADYFNRNGITSVSVHSTSTIRRNEALEGLKNGVYKVVFSVDLFNEGVDVPNIDTVMMLRPTESKILFLQQLGRGLRWFEGKCLHILDFIGNHKSFLLKPQALFDLDGSMQSMRNFIQQIKNQEVELPEGCSINYDLEVINLLEELVRSRGGESINKLYNFFKETNDRRPSAGEFFQLGASFTNIRREANSWFEYVDQQGDLSKKEQRCLKHHKDFFLEMEKTKMSKSFKMVTLEALIENDGFLKPPTTSELALQSLNIFRRRIKLQNDINEKFPDIDKTEYQEFYKWHKYWLDNPVNALIGGNSNNIHTFFFLDNEQFINKLNIASEDIETFEIMLQEIVNFKIYGYEPRINNLSSLTSYKGQHINYVAIPFYPDIKLACGAFLEGHTYAMETRSLVDLHNNLNPDNHFIVQASGDSMSYGNNPILDGDYILLEKNEGGTISNQIFAVEYKQDEYDESQFVLKRIIKNDNGNYFLRSTNTNYDDIPVNKEHMRPFARFIRVIPKSELSLHQPVMRANIPGLFNLEFNKAWEVGHFCPKQTGDHFLLVTLVKTGMQHDHRYQDYFMDESTFHWQSQNSTKQTSIKGLAIKNHRKNGKNIYLFVRKNKLTPEGKGAPFVYCGVLDFDSWEGEAPISVTFKMRTPLSEELFADFAIT